MDQSIFPYNGNRRGIAVVQTLVASADVRPLAENAQKAACLEQFVAIHGDAFLQLRETIHLEQQRFQYGIMLGFTQNGSNDYEVATFQRVHILARSLHSLLGLWIILLTHDVLLSALFAVA